MTIREVIGFADETFPNTFSNETKTKWLSQCDAEIWQDVMLLPPPAFPGYNWDEDADLDLLAPEAYEMLYVYWLDAQMHKAYQEIAEYTNAAQLFNHLRARIAIWYADTFDPAHGGVKPDLFPPTVRQGETLTLAYRIPYRGEDLETLQTIFRTQDQVILTLALSDVTVDGHTVRADLTQAQSLALPVGVVTVSFVGTTAAGKRFETQKAMKIRVRATSVNEVIYGE